MTCTRIPGGFACSFNDGHYRIEKIGRETIYFEWHHYMGPMRIKKNGEPSRQGFPVWALTIINNWQHKKTHECVTEVKP